jgi:hypothetical protein
MDRTKFGRDPRLSLYLPDLESGDVPELPPYEPTVCAFLLGKANVDCQSNQQGAQASKECGAN